LNVPDDPHPQPTTSTDREAPVRPHERPPHPCQHAYTNLRARILFALTRPKQNRLTGGVQSIERAAFLVLDLPARWLMDVGDTIVGNRGYFAIGSVLAAYFAVFGLVDAKSTQEETRASLERSLFITLVSSGNAASFVAAMKDFGPIQTMRATEHPSWFRFWDWGRTYQPNKKPLWHWATSRLGSCSSGAGDCTTSNSARIDLSEADLSGADLHFVDLRHTDLHGTDLRDANLTRASLIRASLIRANLTGADLRNAYLTDASLAYANLTGADLRNAYLTDASLTFANLTGADLTTPYRTGVYLTDAQYNKNTKFPDGFDPNKAGMVLDSP
jgi:hypothetical protein